MEEYRSSETPLVYLLIAMMVSVQETTAKFNHLKKEGSNTQDVDNSEDGK